MAKKAGEATAFLKSHPDIEYLDAFIIDLCGRAIGKRYPASQIEKIYENGTQLCAAAYLLDVCGNTSDPLGYGFSDGDPDADAWPIAGTLVPCPWGDGNGAQCMIELVEPGTREPVWFEPRTLLRNVVEQFSGLGLTPVAALELEYYLIDRKRDEAGGPQLPINPATGVRSEIGNVFGLDVLEDFREPLDAIISICKVQGIPASTAISEYGAGQFEINLDHVADPVKAADDGALLRRAVQMGARHAGYGATFLSKPFRDGTGSGMHIHLSLLDAKGKNVFASKGKKVSPMMRHAIAGLQATMAEAMALFAPNLNVYRRFEPDQFVPVTTDWGENNRSMAFRILTSDPDNARIEHRVAGADANPYLVLAAVLSGIHHGISNNLEPTPMADGNAGTNVDDTLPLRLWDALDRLENAEVLGRYLGDKYLEAYAQVKRAEFDDFLSEISQREHDWYL